MATNWAEKKCVPCEGGVPPLGGAAVDEALLSLDGWDAREGKSRIHKHYRFRDFVEAMKFVNALAEVAEAEGHHPDFTVHWNTVDVELWTHAIGGISENDLIVAAKLDRLPEARAARPEPRH
jgi:4a-hydroxytetrahydrobiopterin dehydratase